MCVFEISLYSLCKYSTNKPLNELDYFFFFIFLLGTYLNIIPEIQRTLWKKNNTNAGKLYTENWFQYCRHINYFGEILSFFGFAFLSNNIFNVWVPVVMCIGMAIFSIAELESYLSSKYTEEWKIYVKNVQHKMIPFVW